MPDVTFIDAPCGQGKTTRAIQNLDPLKSYIIVVPFIDEIRRWQAEASVPLLAAIDEEIGTKESKSAWLRRQIEEGASLVCTHALWDRLEVSGLDLSRYHLIVDEAFEVIDAVRGMTDSAFDKVYLADGWATVDPSTGRVVPTEKWIELAERAAPTIRLDLFYRARQGSLYKVKSGGFFVSLVPQELFTGAKTCTILTYLAEHSIMAGYFRKLGIPFTVEKSDDTAFKLGLAQRLEVKQINALQTVSMSYSQQDQMKSAGAKKVSNALMNLRGRDLVGIPQTDIILSCNKEKWSDGKTDRDGRLKGNGPFANGSTMAKVHWLPRCGSRGASARRRACHA